MMMEKEKKREEGTQNEELRAKSEERRAYSCEPIIEYKIKSSSFCQTTTELLFET